MRLIRLKKRVDVGFVLRIYAIGKEENAKCHPFLATPGWM
jgi:hypothetical protein